MAYNASNNPASAQAQEATSTGSAKSAKRKSVRKASPAAAPTRRSAAARVPEILYKELPNPYHKPVAPFLWIDFPEANERLLSPTYVIRLGVGGAEMVELSIDKGPWLTCRLTSGYWWYDWSKIAPGRHTLVARMRTPDGRVFRTPLRTCEFRA